MYLHRIRPYEITIVILKPLRCLLLRGTFVYAVTSYGSDTLDLHEIVLLIQRFMRRITIVDTLGGTGYRKVII